MADLCEQIRDNDRFARAGHSEQDAVLWRVSQPHPDSDKIASGSIVDRFCTFQMPGKCRRPGNQIREVNVFRG